MNTSKGRVLVTGASSGIGAALARKFAREGFDLILTARRKDRLDELQQELSTSNSVAVLVADLANEEGISQLCKDIRDAELQVDILINNAGALNSKPFIEADTEDLQSTMTLNMTAVARLTNEFLPDMIERRAGKVLNVASMASFHPVPGMDLYAATKSFVLSLTESLAENLRGTGVSVTALCPGLTDTEAMDQDIARTLPPFMIARPEQVAEEGYRALMDKTVICIPGEPNKLALTWAQHQPRWLIRSLGGLAAKLTS